MKTKLESSSSSFSFKSLDPGAFNVGFIESTCTALPWQSVLKLAPVANRPSSMTASPSARGLHSFTLGLNLSTLGTHSWVKFRYMGHKESSS